MRTAEVPQLLSVTFMISVDMSPEAFNWTIDDLWGSAWIFLSLELFEFFDTLKFWIPIYTIIIMIDFYGYEFHDNKIVNYWHFSRLRKGVNPPPEC